MTYDRELVMFAHYLGLLMHECRVSVRLWVHVNGSGKHYLLRN